jgi:dTDP-glucose 4,6-dehydratase
MKSLAPSLARDNFSFIKADICNLDFMNFIMKDFSIDTVMHFAAYSHVDASFGNSLEFTKNNVLGSHVLLESARLNGVEKIISVGSDECYGESESLCDENSMLKATNVYAATKSCVDALCYAYYKSFGMPIVIGRSNNVYGPQQYTEKLIPRFCELLVKGEKLTIQGNGNQKRSFIHVLDICKAYETILFKGVVGEIYNIGTDDEFSVLEIAEKLLRLKYGKDYDGNVSHHITYIKDREFNDSRYLITRDKIEALGWKQEIDFDKGLEETLRWYQDNQNYW